VTKNYILKVHYAKDPVTTLRFDNTTPQCIELRIAALTAENSSVTVIEVYERKAVMTKRVSWETSA